MQQTFSQQEQEEAIAFLQAIIRFNTTNPPGNEKPLAEWLAAWLVDRGVRASVRDLGNDRANLVAELPGTNSQGKLLYAGHLDTVPPGQQPWKFDPFAAARESGVIYGRGTSDMKSGIAAMAYAMATLARRGLELPQDVLLLGTAGEEIDCRGAAAFVEAGGMEAVSAAVIGEPSNGDVIIAHKGAAWLQLTVRGKTAHGSMPHLGKNAILGMNAILNQLQNAAFSVAPHSRLGVPTLSINRIEGGVSTNVVPDTCWCQLDFRLIPGQTLEAAVGLVQQAVDQAGVSQCGLATEIQVLAFRQPVACPENHPMIQTAWQCAKDASGSDVKIRGVNFFTDASILFGSRELPVIFYGPGDDRLAHQPDEHVLIEKYLNSLEFYINFALNWKR